ncbi:polysaccharide biosynthesis tyrosine autokinase [Mycolicibacterium phlei]|uniref:polysaccharide biosynthesis tyrosine autokinase n=1 Tax=Mycolicibacterium phlei TaxID=1771 RepID=UPI00025AF10A|nr:polysaccharide biosynthesis tyrosine autokinase [Mycolicibacterium phlei]EID16745.1 lipopolysaccharide biosynthesis [Mycolicibacterium phlei RIVM601174]MBF4190678.1 lipopolysaccharide biosynthesis [Mycolicibacterium phlei]
MTIQDFIKVLRTRWIVICVALALGLLGSVAVNLLTTPMYQASTRLFVSTTPGESLAETYQGNRVSQDRVISYTQLIMGETLAQRTIDKLDLPMTADALKANVKASAKANTVLINVTVLDESPVRARDIADALSDEFVVMVRELETPESGAPTNARVVVEQRASIPDKPVIPKTMRNIAIGLAVGLVLGIGLALVRDLLDNTIKDKQTLEETTGVGLVGSIPLDKDRRREAAISFDSDNSAIAESFRKLRTNLQFLAVDNPPRVLVITSSMPSEGKSTTAINIALALAEADKSVVIVDGDLRRPRVSSYLGLVETVGFSTALAGSASLSDVIQKTRFTGLSALTSGTIPPNPSELLGSQAAKKVLDELREQFDYVIIDSSPLLAVTDAAILAANADGVLIMARFGQTKREQLGHAVGHLKDVGAPLLGAVFTMTPLRGSSYNYNYNYNYSYSYGYGESTSPKNQRGRGILGRNRQRSS